MKLPVRYKILLYIALPLAVISYLPTICLPYLIELNVNCEILYEELYNYASDNSGFLPGSHKDALQNTQITQKALKQFGFAHGINLRQIIEKENQLYDESGNRVCLLYPKGFRFWLKERCDNYSLQLYSQIKDEKGIKE